MSRAKHALIMFLTALVVLPIAIGLHLLALYAGLAALRALGWIP